MTSSSRNYYSSWALLLSPKINWPQQQDCVILVLRGKEYVSEISRTVALKSADSWNCREKYPDSTLL